MLGVQKAGYAVRNGHMYAYRLLKGIELPNIDDGVVRISLLHYNTPQEVRGLLLALEGVLTGGSPEAAWSDQCIIA